MALGERVLSRVGAAVAIAALAGFVAVLYGPSLRYGLIWDDPLWIQLGRHASVAELLRGSERFQFYRPLTLWYFQQWWRADGTLDASALHAAQVVWHGASACLVFGLARAMRLSIGVALLAGLLLAAFPFAQQAVAWAAPQQPALTALLLVQALAFARFARCEPGRAGAIWLTVALAAYGTALFAQEVAVAFAVWPLAWCAVTGAGRRTWFGALLFPVLAAGHLALWLQAPRLAGVTQPGFDPGAGAFMAQAVGFPLVRALQPFGRPGALPVLVVAGAAWAAAAVFLSRHRRLDVAVLSSVWIVLALLPVWAGLHRAYVEVGQRLVYPSVPGIAVLWAAAAGVALRPTTGRRSRSLAATATILVLAIAVADVRVQNRMFDTGTAHLQEAVDVAADAGGAVLYVNFPDRFALRRPPYPLGYWGVTLAPVVVEISDFARALHGRSARTTSASVPPTGAGDRTAWPFATDLRGVAVGASELVARAAGARGVYVTEYRPDGSLRLARAGAWSRRRLDMAMARFPGRAELVSAQLTPAGDERAALRLVWRRTGEMEPDDTVFVHVYGTDGRLHADADGDAWLGLLPAVDWPANAAVEDVREIDLSGLPPGGYRVTVGLYSRDQGARHPARDPRTGQRFPDDEVPVGGDESWE